MIIEIREMDNESELDVQLARYIATKSARDCGLVTIIEHDDEIYGIRRVGPGRTIEWHLRLADAAGYSPGRLPDCSGCLSSEPA